MTKAEQARIVAWRLRILKHAENEPRHVPQTCRYFGVSRTAFYRWKKRYDKHGKPVRPIERDRHTTHRERPLRR